MFRKEEQAITNWSISNVELCTSRQAYILENAYKCLKQDGILVYSTCTFNKKENEEQIVSFLEKHPDMVIEDANVSFGRSGYPSSVETTKAIRIFPMDEGEGHFICKMKKTGSSSSSKISLLKSESIPASATSFFKSMLEKDYPYYFAYKGKVYGGTTPFISVGKVNLIRHQVYLGEEVHGRFEPSHSLFMSSYTNFNKQINLDDSEVQSYLQGQTISKKCDKGYYAISYHNHVLGYAKSDGSILKNKYPKAFRLKG